MSLILAIDAGTTSVRAIVFDPAFREVAAAQRETPLVFPRSGWVEQDAEDIWTQTLAVCREAIAAAGGPEKIAGIGLANQRETTILWDRATSRPLAPAIVWQDRRTAALCERMRADGREAEAQAISGLVIDPYFSATKIAWLLSAGGVDRDAAAAGRYAFGTVESWLIWKLTGGRVHASDVSNASRTLLMDLKAGAWSDDLCALFEAPPALLPEVRPNAAGFGETDPQHFGRALPIVAAAGDQQAALVGQGCLAPGDAKITLGTGAFLVANTGATAPASAHRLLATKGYDLGPGGAAFALEGSIFNAGTTVKWLRDELRLIDDAAESAAMAERLADNAGVYFVPAFTGLGAPRWAADARGAIVGLSRGVSAAHIVRAGLEAVAYQAAELIDAFAADGAPVRTLRADGGMAANDWLMQFMADICAVPVERPAYTEMTALGAAALAAIGLGHLTPDDWAARDAAAARFEPAMSADARGGLREGWGRAVTAALDA